jgi:hypothetical protein
MPQRQMTLTSQGNMATRPVSNMDKLIKLLRTIEIEVHDKSGKGAWTGARLWYRPLKTPQKREPRRKKKKAREVVAAGRHAGQVVVHNGVPPDWEDHKVICLVCFCNELEDLGADVEGREDLTHAGDCDVLSSPDKVLKCAREALYKPNDSGNASTHMDDRHSHQRDDNSVLEREYLATRDGSDPSAASKKIDYGMAVVRHVGPPINLLDVAISHTRMATCVACHPHRLPLDFFSTPLVIDVLEAVARRPIEEVKTLRLSRTMARSRRFPPSLHHSIGASPGEKASGEAAV